MSEKFEEVRKLIKKGAPLEALAVLKKNSPDNVKKVIENLFDDPTAVNELDDEWRNILSLIYYSYFSFITSTMVDAQSISECAVSSLNAANYSKKLRFPELEVIFLMNAGQALNQMSMNERAIKCYLEAEKIVNKMEDNLAEHAAILNNIGAIYIELKRIDDAKDYLVKALEMRRKLATEDEKYLSELAETLSNAGALFGDKRNYELSEKYYRESISIFRRLAEDNIFQRANLAAVLNNFSIVLRRLRRYDEAEKNIREALEIFKELKEVNEGFTGMYGETLNALGMLYNEMGKHKEAEKYFSEWKEIQIKLTVEKKQNTNFITNS